MPTFSGSMLRTFPNFTFAVCRARNATAISELTPQLPGRHVEVESRGRAGFVAINILKVRLAYIFHTGSIVSELRG